MFASSGGTDVLAGARDPGGRELAPELRGLSADDGLDPHLLQAIREPTGDQLARTMLDTSLDQHPLALVVDVATLQHTRDTLSDPHHRMLEHRIIPAEVDRLMG